MRTTLIRAALACAVLVALSVAPAFAQSSSRSDADGCFSLSISRKLRRLFLRASPDPPRSSRKWESAGALGRLWS